MQTVQCVICFGKLFGLSKYYLFVCIVYEAVRCVRLGQHTALRGGSKRCRGVMRVSINSIRLYLELLATSTSTQSTWIQCDSVQFTACSNFADRTPFTFKCTLKMWRALCFTMRCIIFSFFVCVRRNVARKALRFTGFFFVFCAFSKGMWLYKCSNDFAYLFFFLSRTRSDPFWENLRTKFKVFAIIIKATLLYSKFTWNTERSEWRIVFNKNWACQCNSVGRVQHIRSVYLWKWAVLSLSKRNFYNRFSELYYVHMISCAFN